MAKADDVLDELQKRALDSPEWALAYATLRQANSLRRISLILCDPSSEDPDVLSTLCRIADALEGAREGDR